jgi:hypothetical protein
MSAATKRQPRWVVLAVLVQGVLWPECRATPRRSATIQCCVLRILSVKKEPFLSLRIIETLRITDLFVGGAMPPRGPAEVFLPALRLSRRLGQTSSLSALATVDRSDLKVDESGCYGQDLAASHCRTWMTSACQFMPKLHHRVHPWLRRSFRPSGTADSQGRDRRVTVHGL